MAIKPEMTDEQYAEEIKDLVERLNEGARMAQIAGLHVLFRSEAVAPMEGVPRDKIIVLMGKTL